MTKYGEIDNKVINEYIKRLNKRVFKILPMYEENCETIEEYIENLSREIVGNSKIFLNQDLLVVLGTINGLSLDDHKSIRSDVLKACNILSDLEKKVM